MANPYFDAEFYLGYPGLVEQGVTLETAEQHYLEFGAEAGYHPNVWFSPVGYLLGNPDLVDAGLTRAGALDHYRETGIYEGRGSELSLFTAETYAQQNPDLVQEFGITDVNNLTLYQRGQLMDHYLEFGYGEGRTGAGPFQAAITSRLDMEKLVLDGVTRGTDGNDLYDWLFSFGTAPLPIYGGEGEDGILIGDLNDHVELDLHSIEHVTVEYVFGRELSLYGEKVKTFVLRNSNLSDVLKLSGSAPETVILRGSGDFEGTYSDVGGRNDAMTFIFDERSSDDLGITLNGVEDITLSLGKWPAHLELAANRLEGKVLSVSVTDKLADIYNDAPASANVLVTTAYSPALKKVIADGSDYAGDLTLTLGGDIGDRDIAVPMLGGAGNDTLAANLGADTLTGNAGGDVFTYASRAHADIRLDKKGESLVKRDTILDFTASPDTGAGDQIAWDGIIIGRDIESWGLGKFGDLYAYQDDGVLTFDAGYTDGKTLVDVVSGIADETQAGAGVIFDYGGDAYVFHSDGADGLAVDGLIKLAGARADELIIADGAIMAA